ncbi:MAG: riboflavin synthase [Candidatus Latescibacteria bacterium]|nr:riboflavin synthase [Candidatus Latescibacterota bacterium]NIM21105.1 riboflavin synthase [Candidatus Latescibacterota bacterium]NIM65240.1 riboflavin synthase [Candidatus Latescibacterota bacterium]NIO01755.1 riboflavin synthase [Candidatus Latescibacterota bacterium]NIO28272.1 riboflavin synthase [Candidatus Latescibacterota bacterium]
MFTGIIQSVGNIETKSETAAGARLSIATPGFARDLAPGDSVSVNGVCLTVEEVAGDRFTVTAVGETLNRTTIKTLTPGSKVNLERAATPNTALGGHIVQGHVDCIGQVVSFRKTGQDWLLSIRLPAEAHSLTVPKGSIAIDGVSLTIIDRRPGNILTITIVPFTFENTVIGTYRSGTKVNIETDVIGKYVAQYLARMRGGTI